MGGGHRRVVNVKKSGHSACVTSRLAADVTASEELLLRSPTAQRAKTDRRALGPAFRSLSHLDTPPLGFKPPRC